MNKHRQLYYQWGPSSSMYIYISWGFSLFLLLPHFASYKKLYILVFGYPTSERDGLERAAAVRAATAARRRSKEQEEEEEEEEASCHLTQLRSIKAPGMRNFIMSSLGLCEQKTQQETPSLR